MASQWQFDMQHSGINFMVRHLLVAKVRGRFMRWRGQMRFDERDLAASSVEVQIDASSVDTGEPQRDAHLRSADFLDVARHPHLEFRSQKVERSGELGFRVIGELRIRGVSRPVVLELEYGGRTRDPWGDERVGFTARATIDRKEFGIHFNQVLDHGGLALGEQVAIDIDVEARKVASTAITAALG
jgi:polyisoprenoid-binding protein YceI